MAGHGSLLGEGGTRWGEERGVGGGGHYEGRL
jgi:hypothetical protein